VATIRITRNQLMDVAIQSVRQKNNLSMFWDYVKAARESGFLKMDEAKVQLILDECDRFIFNKGTSLQEQDMKLPDHTGVYGREYWRDGKVVDGDSLDGFRLKTKSILLLKIEIPNYMDVIQPRPKKVYLIDKLVIWPLFKVVATFRAGSSETAQLYLIGRDRHTKQPFALGIPNGFIDMSFDACLRWTVNAHKGDVVIEV